MKKGITIALVLLLQAGICVGQDQWLIDTKHSFAVATNDTNRVLALAEFANYYKLKKPDSSLYYGYKALELAREIKFPAGEVMAIRYLIMTQDILGNESKALQWSLEANKIVEKHNLRYDKGLLMVWKGQHYVETKDFEKALNLFKESKPIFDEFRDTLFSAYVQVLISANYLLMNQVDSASYYVALADHALSKQAGNWVSPYLLSTMANIQSKLGHTDMAMAYYKLSASYGVETETVFGSYFSIAELYHQIANTDSAIFFGKKADELATEKGFYKDIIDVSLFLSDIYEKRNPKEALLYSKKAITYKDSLANLVKSTTQETITAFDEQERQREIEDTKTEFRNRQRMNALIGITFTLLAIAIFLFRNSKLKQKAKRNIQKAYDQLKSTQAQLVQSEKMASLGELTAGIAHEIQNPLNFVNNFSDVNTELLGELKVEAIKGNINEVTAIVDDVIRNEQKINHHGKRADAIVKGMLQHSRASSGQKEPTDINALADEYLRLAYHGIRGKDSSFNVTLKTDFDETVGKISIIPQEIGRVLLNFYNNAFYAVSEKKKQQPGDYEPTVSISTKRNGDKIEIKVRDSGSGIHQNIVDKIFQPFFTTKPTGSGTGLGLSLAYDIVKSHSGEIKVESKNGDFTQFTIVLPA